jgi:hypothetical protein
MLFEKIMRKVETVNSKIPAEKTFFLPTISAMRPKGSRKTADASIKLLITHPRLIAFALRSLPIDGKARLTADPMKGVRKAAKVATNKIVLLDVFSAVRSSFIFFFFRFNLHSCLLLS